MAVTLLQQLVIISCPLYCALRSVLLKFSKIDADILIILARKMLIPANFPQDCEDDRTEKNMDEELLSKLILIGCILAL